MVDRLRVLDRSIKDTLYDISALKQELMSASPKDYSGYGAKIRRLQERVAGLVEQKRTLSQALKPATRVAAREPKRNLFIHRK